MTSGIGHLSICFLAIFGEMFILVLSPYFNWVVWGFVAVELQFFIVDINTIKYMTYEYFLPFCGLPFYSWWQCPLTYISFLFLCSLIYFVACALLFYVFILFIYFWCHTVSFISTLIDVLGMYQEPSNFIVMNKHFQTLIFCVSVLSLATNT